MNVSDGRPAFILPVSSWSAAELLVSWVLLDLSLLLLWVFSLCLDEKAALCGARERRNLLLLTTLRFLPLLERRCTLVLKRLEVSTFENLGAFSSSLPLIFSDLCPELLLPRNTRRLLFPWRAELRLALLRWEDEFPRTVTIANI